MKVFVGYASRHGATQGIAERIATKLERPGMEVTLRPVDQADSVEKYDAFVIGSAAYMGGWLGQATTFVRQHLKLLSSRPVWLFSSGPIGSELVDAKGRDQLEASVPKEFSEFSTAIHPRAAQVFFGAYNPDSGPIGMAEGVMARFMRVVPAIRQALPAGDFRDWNAIDAWAETIARDLEQVRGGILVPA
jgi:menaquinone-dependent protoporphyrinogen oxidase